MGDKARNGARDGSIRIWISGTPDPYLCAPGEKVLSALERDKAKEVRVGCRQGGCGACRVRVISGEYETGKMSRLHVSEEEEQAGFALSCRLIAKTDLTLEPAFRKPRCNTKIAG